MVSQWKAESMRLPNLRWFLLCGCWVSGLSSEALEVDFIAATFKLSVGTDVSALYGSAVWRFFRVRAKISVILCPTSQSKGLPAVPAGEVFVFLKVSGSAVGHRAGSPLP